MYYNIFIKEKLKLKGKKKTVLRFGRLSTNFEDRKGG